MRGKAEAVSNRNVLLVGKSANEYSLLEQRLTNWGGKCRFAISRQEARKLLIEEAIGLVISEMNLVDGSALRLMPLLENSPTSLYSFHPTSNGCLWIPMVEKGKICWGAPTLRPGEFALFLRRTLAEQRTIPVLEPRKIELPAAPVIAVPKISVRPRVFAKAG